MQRFWFLIGLLFCISAPAYGGGYQAQYPYDPYNPSSQSPSTTSYDTTPPPPASSSGGGGQYDKLLSYGYAEVDYSFSSFSNISGLDGGSGLKADLSIPLFRPFYLNLGVDWIRGNLPSGSRSFQMTSLNAGGGVHFALTDRFHIFAEVGARYDVVDNTDSIVLGKNDFSVYVRPGVRFAVTERFELRADVTFNTTNNLNDHVVTVAGYFALLDILDLGVGVDFSSDVNSYFGGLRLRW